ncbi:MAG TPA: DoxX family protein [Phycisphaerae bacterium]|nr:DoxX family protein [Phycisphaerae bacterium]
MKTPETIPSVVVATSSRPAVIVSWVLQFVVAVILFQTLFFKFTAAEESVYIFTKLGMEPWGRIGSGLAELVAGILLLVPRTVICGSLVALGVISGAIVSHLTQLGIVVQGDGGLLFGLALVVFASSAGILLLRRREWNRWLVRFRGARSMTAGRQVVQ